MPFQGKNRNEVFTKIKQGKFHFDHKEFTNVSKEVKDLIRKLLTVKAKDRLSAQQALHHPWFSANHKGSQLTVDHSVIQRLSTFKGQSKLKKAAMNMLVKMTDASKIEGLRDQFKAIDKDGTGLINANELREAITNSNMDIS